MLPYWALFGSFSIASLFARVGPQPDRWGRLFWLAWLILFLMIGLRWQVGPDWGAYQIWWNLSATRPLDRFLRLAGADPGFYVLMWGFQHLGLTYWLLNLAVAAVFAYGLVQFARVQHNPWLAITIAIPYLVIVVAMSGVRQATAIGFIFLALLAFQRQNGWKFLLYIALAASFHASAILVLPLAGLSFVRNRIQAVSLISIVLILAYYELSSTFVRYSNLYLSGLGVQSSGVLFRLGMTALPAAIFLTWKKHFVVTPHEAKLWRNMSLAGLSCFGIFLLISSTTALDRMVLYLFPLQIYVLSWFPSIFRGAWAQSVITVAILIYLALQLFVFLSFGLNSEAYLPYRMLPFEG